MRPMSKDQFDHYEQRCPRLGGPVGFNYCRTCGDNSQTCWKIMDCWWEYFDVKSYLQENLPEETFNSLLNAKPKPKVLNLIELIEAAKNRIKTE